MHLLVEITEKYTKIIPFSRYGKPFYSLRWGN